MTIEWKHEPAIGNVTLENWLGADRFQILAHRGTDTKDDFYSCQRTRCPRTYRDLPHFILFDHEKDGARRYAFELLTVQRYAEAILRAATPAMRTNCGRNI